MATGEESRSPEAVGTKIVSDAAVSFGPTANVVTSGDYTISAGSRSDAFFFDFDGIKNLFDTSGNRNFTAPHLGGSRRGPASTPTPRPTSSPWPSSCRPPSWRPNPTLHIWGRWQRPARRRTRPRRPGRAPSASSFFNTDDTKEEYNASEPADDRERWTDQFVHLLGHTGGYSPEEALAALGEHGLLPDVLTFDLSQPAAYPNGRTFTEDVIDIRVAFLTRNEAPPTGLSPHTDTLDRFPYLGDPHPAQG